MSDQRPGEQPPRPSADEDATTGNPNRAFLAIGVVFMAVGVSFLFNPEMTTVGWTFLPVGVAFLALGLAPAPKSGGAEGDGSAGTGVTDDTAAGGDGGGGD